MAKRNAVEVKGTRPHNNPIPACVTLSDFAELILPSVISGQPEDTSVTLTEPEDQIRQAFANMKLIVERAGGSMATVGRVVVFLKNFSHRPIVDKYWVQTFGEDHNRPARHVLKADIQPGMWIQLDVIAAK
jgi:2-iminobutanoate/2-iminopropanoate deaminase